MSFQIFKIFIAISTYSILIPLIVYLKGIKRFPRANHIVGIYVFAAMICDLAVNVLFYQGYATVIPMNTYYISTFVLISLFYFELVFKKRLGYVLYVGGIIYSMVLVWQFLNSHLTGLQSTLWAIEGFIIGSYGIIYITNLHNMVVDRLLDKNLHSYQIINASFLFYFLTTLILFFSTDYVLTETDPDTSRIFWSFHNIVNTLKNIGLAIGLYYTGRRDVTTTLLEIERIGRERSGEPHDPLWTNALKR
jgi:hypothetical protein